MNTRSCSDYEFMLCVFYIVLTVNNWRQTTSWQISSSAVWTFWQLKAFFTVCSANLTVRFQNRAAPDRGPRPDAVSGSEIIQLGHLWTRRLWFGLASLGRWHHDGPVVRKTSELRRAAGAARFPDESWWVWTDAGTGCCGCAEQN